MINKQLTANGLQQFAGSLKILVITLCVGLMLSGIAFAEGSAGDAGYLFQFGAGARSMGMGKAFVAVADDASATYWNPAGITQVERPEMTSLASNLYEVGQTAGETSKSVTWTTSGPDANWVAGSVGVEISDGYGTLMSGQDYDDSPVSVTHPGYNFSSKDTLTFTISGQQDQGADPSRNTSIYWRNRYYYGRTGDGFTGPGLTGQGFDDDISISRTSANGYTVTFNNIEPSTNFGYILLPTADYSGTPVFRDQSTGFGWPFTLEATYTHTNAYGLGVEYGIWKTNNPFGGTLEIGVEV